jgi:hypothetical protein
VLVSLALLVGSVAGVALDRGGVWRTLGPEGPSYLE